MPIKDFLSFGRHSNTYFFYFNLFELKTYILRDKKTETVPLWSELAMADIVVVETQKQNSAFVYSRF